MGCSKNSNQPHFHAYFHAHMGNYIHTMESSFDKSLCNRCGQVRPPSSSYDRPQNRYLTHLVDELEKCSQSSSDLTKLQKDFVTTKKERTSKLNEVCKQKKFLPFRKILRSRNFCTSNF